MFGHVQIEQAQLSCQYILLGIMWEKNEKIKKKEQSLTPMPPSNKDTHINCLTLAFQLELISQDE